MNPRLRHNAGIITDSPRPLRQKLSKERSSGAGAEAFITTPCIQHHARAGGLSCQALRAET